MHVEYSSAGEVVQSLPCTAHLERCAEERTDSDAQEKQEKEEEGQRLWSTECSLLPSSYTTAEWSPRARGGTYGDPQYWLAASVRHCVATPTGYHHYLCVCVCVCIAEVGGSPLAMGSVEFSAGQEDQGDSKVPAIDNSELCAPESSASKKLPSLTNEGVKLASSCDVI